MRPLMAATFTKEALDSTLIEVFRRYSQTKAAVTVKSRITGDLGIDSLAVMELIAELEDKFGYRFPDDELPKMRMVGDVIAALEKRLRRDGRLG
jgi:acyl carrier protein